MSAITTAQAGNWNVPATWTGGVVPVSGDTVTLNHAVTVTGNAVVGASPGAGSGTAGILAKNHLLINDGVTLSVKGDLKLDGTSVHVVLTLGNGSTGGACIEFDATGAASPSTANYVLQINTVGVQECSLVIAGVSGNRAVIKSKVGGAYASVTGGDVVWGGIIQGSYGLFLRMGDATNDCLRFSAQSTFIFSLDRVQFDTCGLTHNYLVPDGATQITFNRCTWTNTQSANSLVFASNAKSGPGKRVFSKCVFDVPPNWTSPETADITECVIMSRPAFGHQPWGKFRYNLISNPLLNDFAVQGDLQHCVFLSTTATNPHYGNPEGNQSIEYFGCVYEYTGSDPTGDIVNPSFSSTVPTTLTQKFCIKLPNGAGTSSGSMISCTGNANSVIAAYHNTYHGGGGADSSGYRYGETYAGYTNMFIAVLSGLYWDTTIRGWKFHPLTLPGITDACYGQNADYNGGYNYDPGVGKGYNGVYTTAPGAHDVAANPGFVDSTRAFAAYNAYLGGPGTYAACIAEFAKLNDDVGFNTAYTVRKYLTWLREGFGPTNSAFRRAAHDGGCIGATNFQRTRSFARINLFRAYITSKYGVPV